MDPLAKKVAAKYTARVAREGEIQANPVIDNMANSPFMSEGFEDKPKPEGSTDAKPSWDPEGHSEATQKHLPNEEQ